jgi:hypothetical protein
VSLPGFTAQPSIQGTDMAVRFTGNGDMDAIPLLSVFLSELRLEAERLRTISLIFDFTELYFVNSSCLKHFASFIVANKKAARRIKLVFRTDSALKWQCRALEPLHYLDTEFVVIEATGQVSAAPPASRPVQPARGPK